ncbi:C4-dicarboxylate ABC transporter [Agaricicola taiwanensis]|uniref:C4-dicarboxylate ABC transporter n=1 Tax=Agaricicola taiwanensis TaxID=591372 RepID=A0A8J2VIQ6_9RHOB|nr:TRAP transporter substrate-binding protein DctP [Agaricicola taiwanensis]GGE31934.1 C4-dicarboxylate ABC transporter [Agaricicola taiwanensis]
MKRFIPVAVAAACLSLAPTFAKAQAEFNLRWAHYLPNTPFLEIENSFAEAVEKRTDGKVKITGTYAGGLGGAGEILNLAGRGAVDFATSAAGYYPDRLPVWKASQLPFVFDTPKQAIETFKTLREEFPLFDEEMKGMGIRFLFQQPLGSYYFVGPQAGCDTLEGLAGKKIRAFGSEIPKIISAAGAVAITLTTTEMYEAVQRGVIDYANADVGNIASLKLYEVGKNICGPIMTFSGHMMTISERTWAKLPEEYQKIIMEEADAAQQRYLDWVDDNGKNAIKVINDAGIQITPFNADEMAKWKAATPDLVQAWAEDMAKRGKGEEANKIAARLKELAK